MESVLSQAIDGVAIVIKKKIISSGLWMRNFKSVFFFIIFFCVKGAWDGIGWGGVVHLLFHLKKNLGGAG